jgi:mRNA deadenylase 3'-5' endonuclease subunit Ccr4
MYRYKTDMNGLGIKHVSKVSIVSWNIMSQKYTSKPGLTWDFRQPSIINTIKDYDIICLQEVELETINEDFDPLLTTHKYVSHEMTKARTSPIGNAIFVPINSWEVGIKRTSASVTLTLMINNEEVSITNVHLRAGRWCPEKQDIRLRQMKSVVKNMGKGINIVIGDFNTDLTLDGDVPLKDLVVNTGLIKSELYTYKSKVGNPLSFDHVMSTIPLESFTHDIDILDEDYPSDHLPIYTTLVFNIDDSI